MEIKNLNIKVDGNLLEKPIELIILEGPAAVPLKNREPVENNVIGAGLDGVVPFCNHYLNRYSPDQLVEKGYNPIVTYSDDPDRIYVDLVMDRESSISPKINGILRKSKELTDFQFNSDSSSFNNASFCRLIVKNAHCFRTINEAKNLKKQLESFSASFETMVENIDDKKGNTNSQVRTILNREKSGIPDEITFNMPLFQGGPKVEFVASVEIEVAGGSKPEARFGFFSLELSEMLRISAETMVNDVIKQLSDLGVTCIRII